MHESFGTNGRMTEMQAAIGRAQLRKLAAWVETRRRHAAMLNEGFATIPALRVTPPPAYVYHSYYKYYVFVRPERLKPDWSRDRIMQAINDAGIPCLSGSCSEIYREKAFVAAGIGPKAPLPVAHELGETSLMFLVHPTLTEQNMRDTVDVVTGVMAQASR